MARSTGPCLLLVLAALLAGCGGATAAAPGDAGAVVSVTAVDSGHVDSGTGTSAMADATADGPAVPGDAGAPDVELLPPFDASLAAPPSCDAGGYFVTIVDGDGVQILDGGCGDAGAWAVPGLVSFSCGNLCGISQVEACGGGLSLSLQQNYPPPPPASAYVSGPISGAFVDGQGNVLRGTGTIEFGAPPYAAAVGATLAGSYTQTLTTAQGQYAGEIEGTFCVLNGF